MALIWNRKDIHQPRRGDIKLIPGKGIKRVQIESCTILKITLKNING